MVLRHGSRVQNMIASTLLHEHGGNAVKFFSR
jgi:hypothetical protein